MRAIQGATVSLFVLNCKKIAGKKESFGCVHAHTRALAFAGASKAPVTEVCDNKQIINKLQLLLNRNELQGCTTSYMTAVARPRPPATNVRFSQNSMHGTALTLMFINIALQNFA